MADIGTSVLLASVLVGMVSIPAAAGDLSNAEPVSTSASSISAPEKVPSNKVTRTTEDSFLRKVETAFSSFGVKISSDKALTSLEKPGSRFDIKRTPDSTTWTLETSSGDLIVRSTSEGTFTRVKTPYGVLEKESTREGQMVNFTGSNRSKVEQVEVSLRSKMNAMKKEIRERNTDMAQRYISIKHYRQSLGITVKPESPEYVKIESSLSTPVDLGKWNITDESGGHSFSEVSIPPRGTLYVYSGEEPGDLTREENSNYVFNTGISWNDGGDTATLWRGDEKVVQESY